MRNLILSTAAVLAAVVSPLAATTASARPWDGYGRGGRGEVHREIRECHRELRHAYSRRQYERERRECYREIAQARREQWRDRHDEWRDRRHYNDHRDYRGW